MLATVTRAITIIGVALLVACGPAAPRPATPAPATADAGAAPEQVAEAASAPEAEPATQAQAALERGREHNRGWRFDAAVGELEVAVQLFQTAAEPDPLKLMDAMSALGRAYRGAGRWQEAEAVLRRRLTIADGTQDAAERAAALGDLAQAIAEAGDVKRAIPVFEEAIAIDEQLGRSDEHDGKMSRLHNLALALGDIGDEPGAIRLLERVLAADKRKDPVSVSTANTMHNLALNYRDEGELTRAEDLFESAIRIITAKQGADHPRLVPSLNGLAGTLKLAGKLDEAELIYKQILSITGKGRGDGRAIALADLGDLEVQRGRYGEALEHLDEALLLLRRLYPDPRGNPEIVRTLIKRTAAHLGLDHVAEAERDTTVAIRMTTSIYAGHDAEIAEKIDWLADIWSDAGHAKRARILRRQTARARP